MLLVWKDVFEFQQAIWEMYFNDNFVTSQCKLRRKSAEYQQCTYRISFNVSATIFFYFSLQGATIFIGILETTNDKIFFFQFSKSINQNLPYALIKGLISPLLWLLQGL